MKKLFALLLALAMCLSFAACSQNSKSDTPLADALEKNAEECPELYQRNWLVYSWTIKNLDSFKDPASVEMTGKAYYSSTKWDNGDPKFFLVEFRANNSFGGKTVGYAKVTSTGITNVDWEPPMAGRSITFDGVQLFNTLGVSSAKEALAEYISNNYK